MRHLHLTPFRSSSALNRFYRFLRNGRFDDRLLTEEMLRLLGRRPGPLLLALDWTCWHDRFSLLTASVCVGTRSIPVAASACSAHNLSRSQNFFDETLLLLVVDRLRAAGGLGRLALRPRPPPGRLAQAVGRV